MARNSLNLYATKVFSEHPNTLWSLDENVGYLSLLDSDNHNLSNWLSSGAISIASMDVPPPTGLLIDQTPVSLFEEDGASGQVSFNSPLDIDASSINASLNTVSIGMYLFTPDRSVDVILGYEVKDTADQVIKTVRVQNIEPSDDNVEIPGNYVTPLQRSGWAYVSATLPLPDVPFAAISPIIDLQYSVSPVTYQFAVHAVTMGQWSEEFQSTSLGSTKLQLPEEISEYGYGVETSPYGLQGSVGYYVVDNNRLCAKNSGVTMVYGATNSTIITPNPNGPSLILPIEKFFGTGTGTQQPTTYEFWANIESNTTEERRIFGPVGYSAGLYVDRHLLTLKIANKSGSYNVGQWGRPMLINIIIGTDSASLVVNGERVIFIDLNGSADSIESASATWVGFYAYDDVPLISLESFAIYSYEVPVIVQKRRFVYGQGVEEPTSIKGLNHSSIFATNHSETGYSKNISYPKTSSWRSGNIENVVATKTALKAPDYGLPTLFLNKNKDSWKTSDPAFRIKKTDEEGYFYFSTFNFINENIKCVYLDFDGGNPGETLFVFENPVNGESLKASLEIGTVQYSYRKGFSQEYEILAAESSANGIAGFDLGLLAQSFPALSSFLGNIQFCRVYLGGQKDYTNTYSGTINSFSICSPRNYAKISSENFNANGFLSGMDSGHVATYQLVSKIVNNALELDIAIDSIWEDYIPLSYFGSYELNKENEKFFTLDFLQFNVGFPRLERFSNQQYDTTGLAAKMYISFQFLKDGSNKKLESFANIQPLPKNRVVSPGENWLDTAFEVVDDSIIKMPPGFNIKNIGIVVHIHFESTQSIADSLMIKELNISSISLGNQPNRFNTKFGAKFLPYKKTSNTSEYKAVSPFSIGRGDTPYLYLSKNSGIRTLAPSQGLLSAINEGISIPITIAEEATFFKIDMVQMFMRYDGELFSSTTPQKLFEIQMDGSPIEFYVFSDDPYNDGPRGQMYAIQDGVLRNDIMYYLEGRPVRKPILNTSSWTALSMSFSIPLSLERNGVGAIRLTSSSTRFENISYYQARQVDEIDRFAYRKWSAVRSGIDTTYVWTAWRDSTWQEVLYLVETNAQLTDPEEIYGTFVGTNSVIFDSESTLVINNYRHSAYQDIGWSSSIVTPV